MTHSAARGLSLGMYYLVGQPFPCYIGILWERRMDFGESVAGCGLNSTILYYLIE